MHYDAKRATDALATGRGQLKGATGTDWIKDPFVHDSQGPGTPRGTDFRYFDLNRRPIETSCFRLADQSHHFYVLRGKYDL